MAQLAVTPAPVIPYGDPSSVPTDTGLTPQQRQQEAATAESQAQQITSASLSAYGLLPNPQLAFESITTGSTPTVTSLIQAGNPLFQTELAGAPAGGAPNTSPYPNVPSHINDPAQSLWSWNQAAYDKGKTNPGSPDYLASSMNSSWKSFGEAPQMNFGWMQAQQNGGPGLTKKWQNQLVKMGMLNKKSVSGVWDQQTESAFQGFMIQWATPYALFANDATVKSNANEFLNGLNFDVSTLSSTIGRDPSTLSQIAQGWMAAQGPDAGQDQKSELQHYADSFGMAALPDSYQAILHTDPISALRNGLASVLPIGGIPVVGGAYNALLNVLTGNVGDELSGKTGVGTLFTDPRQQRKQQIEKEASQQDHLSKADVANLSPLLQSVADDAGFMGFMSTYDNARTSTILTIWDTLGEVFTKGKLENPFDPMSTPRIEAAAADNNLAAGIFGQGWVNNNPGWAAMFNVVTNIVDDPTSYISLIGKIEEVQRFNGIRTASRVIGDDKARTAFADTTAETATMRVNQGMFNSARQAWTDYKGGAKPGAYRTVAGQVKTAQGIAGLTDIARMYGVTGAGGAKDIQSLQLLQKAMEEPDTHKAWDMIQNGDDATDATGLGWKMQTGKGVWNARAHWTALAQVKSSRLLGKIRTTGGFNTATEWDALANPVGTAQFLHHMSIVAEMPTETIAPMLDKYLHAAMTDPDNAVAAADVVSEAIKHAYGQLPGVDVKAFEQWRGDALDHVVSYAPNPVTGEEQSYVLGSTANMNPAQIKAAQSMLNRLQENLKLIRATGGPTTDVKALEDELNRIARPAPALTTQQGNSFDFGWNPFDMVAYKHPGFRQVVKFQRWSGIDRAMNAWRRLTIARVSSAMRMDVGDDMIRPFTQLMFSGHVDAATRYITNAMGRMFGVVTPGVSVAGKQVVPSVRKAVLKGLDTQLEENPEFARMLQTVHKTLQETSTNIWQPIEPTGVGYATALADQIRNHWYADPMVQTYLKAYKENPDTASDVLKQYVQTALDAGKPDRSVSDALNQYQRAMKPIQNQARDESAKGAQAAVKSEALKQYQLAAGKDAPHPDVAAASARVAAHARAQNAHLDPELMDSYIKRYTDMLDGYMVNPAIREMATSGRISMAKIQKLVRDEAGTPHRLPIINARQSTPQAQNFLSYMVNKAPNAVFEHVTGPMINTARGQGFLSMKNLFENTMRKHFEGSPKYGTPQFEAEIENAASAQAIDWILNNTYQGTRSVLGASMRNVLPFYGATANMDRFFMRQTMANPFVGSIVAHTAEATGKSQNPQQVNSPGLVGLQGMLAHLGFGAGEGVQFNPLHAFFLTSDGIGSMVPGTGPIFAPLWNAASTLGNGNLAQILSDTIPGATSQIDFNTGKAKPQFPWLADLLTGISMSLTGQNLPADVPVIGSQLGVSNDTVNADVEKAVQAYERDHPGVSVDSQNPDYNNIMQGLRQQVGRDLTLQGGASYLAPVDPVVENAQQQASATNLDTWRSQTTDKARDSVILQFMPGVTSSQWQAALVQTPGVPTIAQLVAKNPGTDAALMAYEDARVSQADRDAIANAEPWVQSALQSKYQTASLGPDQPDRPFDLPQWQVMRQLGNITNLTPDQFTGAVANERDINTGWLEYDNLKNQEYSAMVQNGWTTTSPQYQAWNSAIFQPQLISIQGRHPAWWTRFGAGGGGQTAADLAGKTRSLRTLQTWEVLPQHSDFENQQTVLWRNALQLRDNAAGQIYALKAGGGSTAEQQLVMQSLQQQLEDLAAQDPTFASMLGGFRFATWEDVVTLEADEMQANMLAGYPAQVGVQGQG